jgi:hypothetical protein
MSHQRPPPPEPEDCLIHSRVSRYKGGTLIAEGVVDLATHLRRLADPDGYRPAQCPRCGGQVLHVHDYPHRKPREGPAELRIVRHICADPSCEATWRILPAFLARHLWSAWPTVERTVSEEPRTVARAARVAERTAQRWRSRLWASAKQLVVLLATSGGTLLEAVAKTVGFVGTRLELVEAHACAAESPPGRRLSDLAALVHRLERGIRLM